MKKYLVRLLLDLLAATSGLAPCLRVMALLDKSFRGECQPIIHSLGREFFCENSRLNIYPLSFICKYHTYKLSSEI